MDAYGNFTSLQDFTTGSVIQLTSYLDPDIVLDTHAVFDQWGDMTSTNVGVHRLSNGPTTTSHLIVDSAWEQDPSSDQFCLLFNQYGVVLSWAINGPRGFPLELVMVGSNVGPDYSKFTVDFVDGPWFALNTPDRTLVADISESGTAEGSPIIGFPWNGGANQIWRAQRVGTVPVQN
jgi:hypothetical protein